MRDPTTACQMLAPFSSSLDLNLTNALALCTVNGRSKTEQIYNFVTNSVCQLLMMAFVYSDLVGSCTLLCRYKNFIFVLLTVGLNVRVFLSSCHLCY